MIKITRKNVFFTAFAAACLVYGITGDSIEKSLQVKSEGKLILVALVQREN